MIPSVEDAAIVSFPMATATKTPVVGLQATPYHCPPPGIVLAVHVIPLVEDAPPPLVLTATKIPVLGLHVTAVQYALEGIVRAVHVIPSVEDAAPDEN